MRKDDCFLLGYVIKPHGLKGELILQLDSDDPAHYETMESVFLEIQGKLVPFFIVALNIQGERAIVSFEEIDSLDAALALKGAAVYLPDEFLPLLEKDQFYFHQVIGYELHDTSRGGVGSIRDIYESGKQYLFAVDHQGKEILIPVSDDLLQSVDHDQHVITMDLPEGLLDIYLEE